MDLSVIIVSWQVKERLRANLSALFRSTGDFKFEVIVVDNASGDGSAAMVRAEFSSVRLIANSENLGFARANNQAIREAAGDFILLLNPDMLAQEDTLAKILAWAKNNPQATVVGCRLEDERGEIVRQVRRFPTLSDQLLITLKIPHLWPASVKGYLCADFDYGQAAAVASIRGAFFLINRESYRRISGSGQPLLDERYFIWFEEVDFCRQVHKLGGEVWYAPVATCRDYVGRSFAQVPRGAAQKYFRDSMLKYFEKWGKRWEATVLRAAWSLVSVFI